MPALLLLIKNTSEEKRWQFTWWQTTHVAEMPPQPEVVLFGWISKHQTLFVQGFIFYVPTFPYNFPYLHAVLFDINS